VLVVVPELGRVLVVGVLETAVPRPVVVVPEGVVIGDVSVAVVLVPALPVDVVETVAPILNEPVEA